MSFLAVHVDAQLALSTDATLIPPEQVRSFTDALALAEAMGTARDAQAERLAAARQAGYAEGRAHGLLEGRREAHTSALAKSPSAVPASPPCTIVMPLAPVSLRCARAVPSAIGNWIAIGEVTGATFHLRTE